MEKTVLHAPSVPQYIFSHPSLYKKSSVRFQPEKCETNSSVSQTSALTFSGGPIQNKRQSWVLIAILLH